MWVLLNNHTIAYFSATAACIEDRVEQAPKAGWTDVGWTRWRETVNSKYNINIPDSVGPYWMDS